MSRTYGQLGQSAAQLLSDVSQLLQFGLLLPAVLARDLLTQPLVRLLSQSQLRVRQFKNGWGEGGGGDAYNIYVECQPEG